MSEAIHNTVDPDEQLPPAQASPFTGGDTLVAPNGHRYTVRRPYYDGDNVLRLVMYSRDRRDTMYPTVSKMDRLTSGGEGGGGDEWGYIPNTSNVGSFDE